MINGELGVLREETNACVCCVPLMVNLNPHFHTPLCVCVCVLLQCLTGSLLRGVLVLLLASCCAKPKCDYREILGSYREVVFIELHNLV